MSAASLEVAAIRQFYRSSSFRAGALALLVMVIASSAAGCRAKAPAGSGRSLTVAGSTSVQPFAEILAEDFYKKTGTNVNVQGGGSSAGAQAARSHVADIGTLSRELKPDEAAVLTEFVIAHDAIAIVVNPRNPVAALTSEQVRAIFSGKITDWAQVDGPPGPITVISREEGSGTRGAFDELVMGKAELTPRALVQDSNGAVKETVAQDPRAIGYISLGIVDARVRMVTVDGIAPSVETVLNEKYSLVRPFLFVTAGPPQGHVKEFIDFVLGPEGQQILRDEGLVPAGPTQ